ncbi:MAG TPA: hypothetical protein PKB10_04970 [Tepidisphaeraceae bacterium]|nr:hypothetical protein [Tepidisphaeraceae bacterium]
MNNLSELSPEILRKDGKAQFAVLPWEQYVALREMVEDAMDVLLIREARAVDAGSPSVPVDAVLKRFGLEPNGGSEDR